MSTQHREHRSTPAPLVPTAIGLVLGIVLSQARSPLLGGANCLPVAGLLLLGRGGADDRRVRLAALLVGVACGLLRAEATAVLPGDHIGRIASQAAALVRVEGIVLATPRHQPAVRRNPHLPFPPRGSTRLLLAVRTCNGTPRSGRVQVQVYDDVSALPAGSAIGLSGWLRAPQAAGNPGAFDHAAYLRGRGIHATLSVPGANLVHAARVAEGWAGSAALLRGAAWEWLGRYGNLSRDERTLLGTMVLGHRSVATPDLNEAFARTGGLHYLAVSGFHVGILLAASWWVLRRARCSEPVAASLVLVILAGYAVIAEPNAPILRASVLGGLWCVSRMLGRGRSPANWLSAAAALLLWIDPAGLWQPGFQLSFLQVAMLLWLGPRLLRRGAGHAETWTTALLIAGWRRVGQLLVIAAASWLTAAPLVALHFERIAPWGALHSALLAPLVVLTLLVGMAAVPLAGVASLASAGWLLQACCGLLLRLVEWLGSWPGSLVEAPAPPVWAVLASYALAGVAIRLLGPDDRERAAARPAAGLMTLALVLLCGSMWWPRPFAGPRLCVLDVRAGSAALLQQRAGGVWLFDVGTRGNFDCAAVVRDASTALGLSRPEAVFLSHDNLDHYSGLEGVRGDARRLSLWSNPTLATRVGAVPLTRGASSPEGVEVLWPPADLPAWVRENDRSLVLRVSVGSLRVLLPGDIEGFAMTGLLELAERGAVDLRADVLVAPHHGSVLPPPTRGFYAAVAPRWVIASSDRPRPDLHALAASLFQDACRVLVTAEVGAVLVADGAVAPAE